MELPDHEEDDNRYQAIAGKCRAALDDDSDSL